MGILGIAGRNNWMVDGDRIDLTRQGHQADPITFPTETESITIDLGVTALVVVDMQRDFCSDDGWAASQGADLSDAERAAEQLAVVVPALRANGVPIIWVNWGNRPDRANLPPNVLRTFDRAGTGAGIGSPHPATGHRVLEVGSPSAGLVDGLEQVDGDFWVDKYRLNGFIDTELDGILRNLAVRTTLFAGVNADQCVMFTLAHAAHLGYDVVMLKDCCATTSPAYCWDATLYNISRGLGFVADSLDVIEQLPR